MAIRHYVLLATDGYTNLPTTPNPCAAADTLKKVYIFGFVGGLYKVDEKIVNPDLDWTKPENWPKFQAMIGTATLPSPIIWGEVYDKIYITLINLGMPTAKLMDFHTVHMHGAHVATQIDGFPETSFGVPMWMDVTQAPPTATYFFEPDHPGTLMYHCHIEASEHVQMGMYGAFIIYPSMKSLAEAGITKNKKGYWKKDCILQYQIPKSATNRNFAYNDINTYYDKEYIMLLSDLDSAWHESVEKQTGFNAVDFKPDYWLVNGRAYPHTILPYPKSDVNKNSSNADQISYDSYVHVKTNEMFLLRMINMGYQVVPWHIHGWHFAILGKDSHPSPNLMLASMFDMSGHKAHEILNGGFTLTIGSGETYDIVITAEDKRIPYRSYIVEGKDGIASLCSQMIQIDNEDSAAIFNTPLEPVQCPNPNTINPIQICRQPPKDPNDKFFPQFYPMHNHDDYKVTNNGVYPGGQLTLIQVDAPDKCPMFEADTSRSENKDNNNF